jgi:prepilin-type N-terminal cleavage/methylation domain-containing protein
MKTPPQKKHAGFTLIEMMLAMAVTLVLLYTAVQIFRDATYSNQVVVQAADMSDNLRAGLNMIQEDLQQAGQGIPVGGISTPYTSNGSTTSPCSTTTAINRPKLGGTTTFPQCNSTMPAIEPGNELGPPITAPDAIAGTVQNPNSITDEITVLYADNTLGLQAKPINQPPTANPPTTGCPNGKLQLSGTTLTVTFDATNCINLAASPYTTVNAGDLVMFTNSQGSAILYVTGASGNTLTFAGGDPFALNGRTEQSGTIQQLETSTTCGGAPACFPATTATRIWMVSYYLDNVAAPPFVRLVRQINMPPAYQPTPVGETMENLQFTYNFVDGATNPSNQSTVPAGNSESQIRSVNVYLGARSSYQVHSGNTLAFARSNLMTQVSLRSMAYTNRYP